jgi:O-acetylhomoserine/O-acetylserine sulfhydrylase-like pyridoxal-dependent enzyme
VSAVITNGIYALTALAIDGADVDVGGVLILHDGKIYGGDSYVFYEGTYECFNGKWQGAMTSREHTPTTRPVEERVQHISFSGEYTAAGAEASATAIVGKQHIRYDATLRLLAAA